MSQGAPRISDPTECEHDRFDGAGRCFGCGRHEDDLAWDAARTCTCGERFCSITDLLDHVLAEFKIQSAYVLGLSEANADHRPVIVEEGDSG